MLLYKTLFNEESSSAHIELSFTANKIGVEYAGRTFEFDVSLVNFFPDIATLIYCEDGEFRLQWNSEAINDKAGYYSALWRKKAPMHFIAVASFFAESPDAIHIFTRIPVVYTGDVEVHQVEGNKRTDEVFAEFNATAKALCQRAEAKKVLLGKINTNDSMAMLEAQLDLLTHVVLNDDKAEESRQALAEAVSTNTVDTIHAITKLKETVTRQKTHLRTVQQNYLNTRGDLENADLSS